MNKRDLKVHFQRYIFNYIITFLLLVGINIVAFYFINDSTENRKLETDFSRYNETIENAYKLDPSLFPFGKNGVAKVKVDSLMGEITNGKDTQIGIGIIPLTKEQDQCVGYIIVKKASKNKINIDTSHFCDIIDY